MSDTIELVKSNNNYSDGLNGKHIIFYLGEPSVKYPNILIKSASEVPKILLSKGATKDIKAQVFINRTSSSSITEEQSRELAGEIAKHMRLKGFRNCTFRLNLVHSSPKVLFEGKSVQMVLAKAGARAYTSGIGPDFGAGDTQGKGSQGKGLIAHELTHVVQQ